MKRVRPRVAPILKRIETARFKIEDSQHPDPGNPRLSRNSMSLILLEEARWKLKDAIRVLEDEIERYDLASYEEQ